MNHEKLITLPCQYPEEAKNSFKKLIFEEAYLLFIVLGTGETVNKILDLATKAAGSNQDPGMVIWITDYNVVSDIIESLEDPLKMLNDIDNTYAFALSIMDKVVDVIKKDESRLDILRIWKSFQLALKG